MKNGLQNRIETILSSLDQVQRASAPDYLYTRIKGRLQSEESKNSSFWLLRPVPLIGLLSLFLIINASLILNQELGTFPITAGAENLAAPSTEVPYAVAAEYRLHDNVTFYDNGREISSR
ncbi:MAG: hypothetical protein ACO3AY_01565 [Chitinophagaceae bacterium]